MTSYKKYTWFIVIFVFLVVLAGGIVRTTQSGMGCPDWPKCFGMWIPPTKAEQLPPDFVNYLSKQDIDHTFNVYHTWIEYINRLLGAILGLLILIHLAWTIRLRNVLDRSIIVTSIFMLIGVLFTAWLGKVVVDNNLAVMKVTLHMLSALVLAILPLFIIVKLNRRQWLSNKYSLVMPIGLLILCLVQLYLGTNVRESVDEISKSLNYGSREQWIDRLGSVFDIHRTFSWTILFLSIYLFYKSGYGIVEGIILGLVLFLFVLGLLFVYASFPAFVQPLHLLSSMMLITLIATAVLSNYQKE
jgi:cytochrome c oxidase assembly protein subunit 15